MRLWLLAALLLPQISACKAEKPEPLITTPAEKLAFVVEEIREPVPAWEGRAKFKRDLIKRYGHARYLNLVGAQIMQESLWKADAESWVGAQGCGQFMPMTQGDAKYWARDLGTIDWQNCEQSVRASIRYMKAIYRRIDGEECYRYREAIKDYNRGMGWGDKERRLGYCVRNERACDETEHYHVTITGRHQKKFFNMQYGEHLVCQ